MRSKQLNLDLYETNKIPQNFLKYYDPFFEPLIDSPVKLLEIGVHKGHSLLLWRDYFPSGTIAGVDIQIPRDLDFGDRIYLFEGNQRDEHFLTQMANEIAPDGFDIIIDDASHLGAVTKKSFWHLFENHLKPSGLYSIEDWGTGYWNEWPDGKGYRPRKNRVASFWSNIAAPTNRVERALNKIRKNTKFVKFPFSCHSYGMVGFIKELVDEQAAVELTRENHINNPKRHSKFESIVITPKMVITKKAQI